ncbi:hypothetical protein RI054_10g54040 [Pseudoscourfieldia marina]
MASRDAFGMSNSDNNNAENSSGGDNASGGRRSSLAGGSQPLRPASDPTARMRTLFYGILIFSLGMSAAFFAHAVYTMKRMQHIQEDILTDDFKEYKYAIIGNLVMLGFALVTLVLYLILIAFFGYRSMFGDRHRNRARGNPLSESSSLGSAAPRRGALHGAWLGMAYCTAVQLLSACCALSTTKPLWDNLDKSMSHLSDEDKLNPQRIVELAVLGFLAAIPHLMVVAFLIFFVDVLYGTKLAAGARYGTNSRKPVAGNAFEVRENALAEGQDVNAGASGAAPASDVEGGSSVWNQNQSVFGQATANTAHSNSMSGAAPTMEAQPAQNASPFGNPWGS